MLEKDVRRQRSRTGMRLQIRVLGIVTSRTSLPPRRGCGLEMELCVDGWVDLATGVLLLYCFRLIAAQHSTQPRVRPSGTNSEPSSPDVLQTSAPVSFPGAAMHTEPSNSSRFKYSNTSFVEHFLSHTVAMQTNRAAVVQVERYSRSDMAISTILLQHNARNQEVQASSTFKARRHVTQRKETRDIESTTMINTQPDPIQNRSRAKHTVLLHVHRAPFTTSPQPSNATHASETMQDSCTHRPCQLPL
jgi:hypothetical protein